MQQADKVKNARTSHEQRVRKLAKVRGLFRARDAAGAGIPTVVLTRMVRTGQIERVARGLYTLPGSSLQQRSAMVDVAVKMPRAVICLLSALRLHDIGTQSPFEVWVALPPGGKLPQIQGASLRAIRMSGPALTEGIQKVEIEGMSVRVFSAAKTVVDCFKFRNKIGLDVALEALREAKRARMVSMDELWRYARICRVEKVMRPYLEALA